ncbi:hypothetical protein TIFTF001_013960 [Ficus carica]|uniref:BED-type domain-containing protein n=1 Tax=Ficus carica TaxID=3494 RepID=A0AA87ZVY7_FICCA|nr:hypothetical protein TIFTF001_013960 [Ficus carica]
MPHVELMKKVESSDNNDKVSLEVEGDGGYNMKNDGNIRDEYFDVNMEAPRVYDAASAPGHEFLDVPTLEERSNQETTASALTPKRQRSCVEICLPLPLVLPSGRLPPKEADMPVPACLSRVRPLPSGHICLPAASALSPPPLAVYHLTKQICPSAESVLSPLARSAYRLPLPSPLSPLVFESSLLKLVFNTSTFQRELSAKSGNSFLEFEILELVGCHVSNVVVESSVPEMDHVDLESQSENLDLEKASNVDIDLDEDVIELDGSDPNQPLKKKRLKSKVWEFFDVLPLGPDKNLNSAYKKCGHQYLASSKYGTCNMLKHIKTCPRTETRDIGQMLITCESVDQDMNDVIQNVVNLNIDEEKTVDQDSNSGCA